MKLWFGCIYPYESFLEFCEKDKVINKLLPLIQNHIAYCYEVLCRQYVKFNMHKYNCLKIGRQWDRIYEIDIAGVNENNLFVLLGECKWSNTKVGLSVYYDLIEKVKNNNLQVEEKCRYLLFSKSGFTEELIEKSEDDNSIELISNIFL